MGILKKVSSLASKKRLKGIAAGLFYSKLNYCLPLFSNIWGLDSYKEGGTRFSSFTKDGNRKIQVLQNKVARLLVGKEKGMTSNIYTMSTKELLFKSGDLSVQQMGAYQTLVMTKKIVLNQKPKYLADKLLPGGNRETRSGATLPEEKTSLGLSREEFINRGVKLFNLLPEEIKSEKKLTRFKTKTTNLCARKYFGKALRSL